MKIGSSTFWHRDEIVNFHQKFDAATIERFKSAWDVGNAFFSTRVVHVCSDPDAKKIFDRISERIVRLKYPRDGGEMYETTGIVFSPGIVVTPYLLRTRDRRVDFGALVVESIDCVGNVTRHAATATRQLKVAKQGDHWNERTAFHAITVPTLGPSIAPLSVAQRGTEDHSEYRGDDVIAIGFSYNIQRAIPEFPFRRPDKSERKENNNILAARGTILWADTGSFSLFGESGANFANDAPMPAGMAGAPLLTMQGEPVGIQVSTWTRGGWLPFSRAIPIGEIAEALASPPTADRGLGKKR